MSLDSELRAFASELGVDSVGVASVEAYSALVENDQKPSYLVDGMKSIVVVTKHILTGAMQLRDVATQSTSGAGRGCSISSGPRSSPDWATWG